MFWWIKKKVVYLHQLGGIKMNPDYGSMLVKGIGLFFITYNELFFLF